MLKIHMLQAVFEEMPGGKYKQQASEIKVKFDKLIKDVMKTCEFVKEMGKVFDEVMDPSEIQNGENWLIMEYCNLKYVLDHKLLDTSIYKIELNLKKPENLKANFQENMRKT